MFRSLSITYLMIFLFASSSVLAGIFKDPMLYENVSVWHGFKGSKFRVKLCRITSNGAQKDYKEKKIKVFFDENKHYVKRKYRAKIKRFIRSLPKTTNRIIVKAHADQCGDPDYNHELSKRRFVSVYQLMKRAKYPRGVKKIEYDLKGESESSSHSKHDKFVEIIARYTDTKQKFRNIVIMDISGSIHPANRRKTVSGADYYRLLDIKFSPGTIAYVARDARHKCQGTALKNYKAIGEDVYNEASIIISKYLRGPANGSIWTDFTDPKNPRARQYLKAMRSDRKIKWMIY